MLGRPITSIVHESNKKKGTDTYYNNINSNKKGNDTAHGAVLGKQHKKGK
jgi:hypothetical protein